MESLTEKIFNVSTSIRYVAIYMNDTLISSERPGIENTSSSESDKYEELIVNPTLLKLVTQRGNIDCGGAEFLIIKYGAFYEFVMPLNNGHISVGIEPLADVISLVTEIRERIK
jgi:hypothetical protein